MGKIIFIFLVFICVPLSYAVVTNCGSGDTAGMISYWGCEENTGVTIADTMGVSSGSLVGINWTAGKMGYGLIFDGIDDYSNLANESNFDFEWTSSFTIECWIYISSSNKNYPFLDKRTISGNATGWFFGENNESAIVLQLANSLGGGFRRYLNTSRITMNTWVCLIATYNGTGLNGIKLYLNGTNYDDANYSWGNQTATCLNNLELWIGKNRYEEAFNGRIDEVAVYNVALSTQTITDHYTRSNVPAHYCPYGTAGSAPNPRKRTGKIIVLSEIYE